MTPDDAAHRGGHAAGDALLIDGHAHFRPRFSAAGFLDAAARNLRRWTAADGEPDGSARRRVRLCLMLADPPGRDSLRALSAGLGDVVRWEVRDTAEDVSRVALGEEGGPIGLIAGRQVATEEGLEVLALATDAEIPDGRSARETVERSLAAGAVTVLPWGFGKWWFRRGRLVRRLVESVDHPLFFLGDNGGRPRTAPEPSLFRAARRRGTAVLAGSDPLPFSREEERVGSYGFVLPGRRADDTGRRVGPPDGPADGAAPAAAVRAGLERLAGPPPTFGRREGLGRFAVHQMAMRLAPGRGR